MVVAGEFGFFDDEEHAVDGGVVFGLDIEECDGFGFREGERI